MQIVKSYLTQNPCYKNNVNKADSRYVKFQERGPQGLMLHSIGCPQPSAKGFLKACNSVSYNNACVHGFIDANDGTIYQTLPWNFRGWHGASGSKGCCNDTHIGVEMCEPDCIKYCTGATFNCSDASRAKAMVTRTYNSAVYLFATLCNQYHLDPMKSGVVISHKEGNALGIASNHGDPEHLWRQLGLPYTMDTFRRDVKNKMIELEDNDMTQEKFNEMFTIAMNDYRKSLQDNDSGSWSDADKQWVIEKGIFQGSGNDVKGKPNYMWQDFVTREQIAALLHRAHNVK